jgi:hypothetical protein
MLGFALFGMVIYTVFIMSGPASEFANAFVSELSSGDTASAIKQCDVGTTDDEVKEWSDRVKALGPITNVEFSKPLYAPVASPHFPTQLLYAVDAIVSTSQGKRTLGLTMAHRNGRFFMRNVEPE